MKKPSFWLKLLGSLLFVGLLTRWIDVEDLRKYATGVDPLYLGLSLGFSFLMVAASTWKWWVITRLQEHPLPFLRLYRWYFVGYFYSNLLPSNVGGDVARAWYAGRGAGGGSKAVIGVFVERITGLMLLLALAVGLPLSRPDLLANPGILAGMAIGLAGLCACGLGLLGGRLLRRHAGLRRFVRALVDRLPRGFGVKVTSRAGSMERRLGELAELLRRRPSAVLSIAALTLLFYAMMLVNVALAYRAFGEWPDLAGIAVVLPAAMLVAMIPVTMGSLGIAESSYVYFFGLAGMDGGLTLAMALLLRVKVLMLGLVGMAAQAVGGGPAAPETPPGDAT